MGKWMFFRHIFALFALVVTLAGCSSLSTIKSDEPAKYETAPGASEARNFFTRSGLRSDNARQYRGGAVAVDVACRQLSPRSP